MAEFRDFDAEAKAKQEGVPETIEFGLSGRKFRVETPIALGGVVLMARALSDNDQMRALSIADRMIRGWLPEDQHSDWDDALLEVQNVQVVDEVMQHIIQTASGRPTSAH